MNLMLFVPPIAFLIMLLISLGISGFSMLFAAKGTPYAGKERAYACGQNIDVNKIQPDYQEFFPIAFFFTIMHVAALIIATAPKGELVSAVLFIAVALLALKVLFRRDDHVSDR